MLAFIDNPIGIAAIFILALLLFGPDKLPQIAGQLGRALRELRRTASDLKSSWDMDAPTHYEPPHYDPYPYNGNAGSAGSVLESETEHAASPIVPPPAALPAQEPARGDFAAAAFAETDTDYSAGAAPAAAEKECPVTPQEPLRPQPAEGTVPRNR